MALQWIRGDFKTGNISESAILPVIKNGDKVEPDINAGDSATLTVSRADLPSDWRTYLEPGKTLIALVDTDVAFASGVMWAGRVNRANATVKGTVNIQVTGLNQYLAKRIITSVYNTTDANPNSSTVFTSSTWQGVMKAVIQHCFSLTGIPAGAPTPPQILGTISGTVSGTTYKYEAKNSDAIKYADALDEIRDSLSPGNEYRFVPRWGSSAKTNIVFDAVIGTDGAPHIGESTTRTIQIADNLWKPLSFGQTASADNIASRIIAQSTAGSGTTGSDFTSKTSTAGTTILEDVFFNPGVPLTAAEMTAQLNSRIAFAAVLDNEATFERSYDTLDELRTMVSYLGNLATFTGTEQAAQFGTTMRIVGISYSPEQRKITVSLLPKAAKYPKLPKDRNSLGGSDSSSPYDSSSPLTPRTPINTPPVYTPPVTPPFTLPGDKFTEAESVLEAVDMRHFAGWDEFGDKQPTTANASMYWHRQPDVTRSRVNYDTGEMIGLATASRILYGFNDNTSTLKDKKASATVDKDPNGTVEHNKDLDIWSVKIPEMFDSDSNPYMNRPFNTTPNADSFKTRIGGIPYTQYMDLEIDPTTFKASIPASNTPNSRRVVSIADFNLFCTQDLQTIYIQVMVTTSTSQIDSGAVSAGYKSYSTTLSKLFKGTRTSNGLVEFTSLGDVLSINKGTADQKTFFSTAIYEIQGQFHAFGGYLIPKNESGVKAPTTLPSYELKFYQHGHTMVNVSNFIYNMEEVNLPGLTMLETGSVNEDLELKAKFPYAINVDYLQQKMSLGISRGANGKLSQYFYSNFSNLLSFQKILSTDRENPILWDVNNPTIWSSVTVPDPFRFRSKAPIFYKNNFFLFSGSGASGAAGGTNGVNTFAGKQINHIRAKVGFDDTVSGALKLDTAFVSNAAKNAYIITNSTANSGDNLGAFGNYMYRAISSFGDTRNVYGMEYFVYKSFLYMILDSTFSEYENTNDRSVNQAPYTRYRYWIGKFRVRDEIL